MRGILAAALAGTMAFTAPVALLGVGDASSGGVPTVFATGDIPAAMLTLYESAAPTCPGLGWPILAGIGKVETDHGRNVAVSSAGAEGPMQFLPATFAAYAVDGDVDGRTDINDPADAVFTAAHLLCANGAGDPHRLASAIYDYNHDAGYVGRVLAWAVAYGIPTIDTATTSTQVSPLLANPRLTLSPNARGDLSAGIVDARIVAILTLLLDKHTLAVSVFKTGHSEYVAGTNRVSNHYYGRAVDIYEVDGQSVTPASTAARTLVNQLATITGVLAPTEVGSPFVLPYPGFFTDADHQNHVHIGYGPA
jgi:hypothetical protein